MAAIVRADAVAKRWGSTQALSGATFEIGPGITGLLGANGAGKTTMLGLILGMHRPDEPTNGLDPVQRERMLALTRRVGHDLGLNVILSSHLLDEVERVSDAVVIIDGGKVTRSGRLEELRGEAAAELLVEVDTGAEG